MITLLIIPVFLQVVSRMVPFIPRYIWTEELARFAFVWVIMIGATIAVRENTHFHIDVLPAIGKKTETLISVILFVLMLVMAAVFVLGGIQFARFGATQHSEIFGLPMVSIYIAWPFLGVSSLIFLIEQVYDFFNSQTESGHGTT